MLRVNPVQVVKFLTNKKLQFNYKMRHVSTGKVFHRTGEFDGYDHFVLTLSQWNKKQTAWVYYQ